MSYKIRRSKDAIACTVPVTTSDATNFREGVDWYRMAQSVSRFVTKRIGKEREICRYDTQEMMKNSFDSFVATRAIRVGMTLEFSAAVRRCEREIVVIFKDNGGGIARRGTYFKVTRLPRKPLGNYFGGNGIALRQMEDCVRRNGGALLLKNRRCGGCSVRVSFPLKSSRRPPKKRRRLT